MKIEELRIGNYVKHNSDWCYRGEDVYKFQWDTIDWFALGECTLFMENIEPIPLSEEWLLDFGFKKNKSIWTLNEIEISSWFTFRFSLDPLKVQEIDFVHQLQNLYYALTGTDLIMKS